MKFVVYICFRISFAYFACQEYIQSFNSFGRQSHDWRHWFRLWNLTPLNIHSTLQRHNIDKLFDKFPTRNIILCTYSKLNTIKDGYSFNKSWNIGLYFAPHAASVPPFS